MPRAPLLSQQPSTVSALPTVTRSDQSPAAFGAGLGQAVQQAGQNVAAGQSAIDKQRAYEDRLFAQESETRGVDASNSYAAEISRAKTEATTLQGYAALDASAKFREKAAQIRQKYEGDLNGNPLAVSAFGRRANILDMDADTTVTAHAVAQKRGADIGTYTASAKASSDVVVRNAENSPAVYQGAMLEGQADIRRASLLSGRSPTEAEQDVAAWAQRQHSEIVQFRIGTGDLAGASRWFDANRKNMSPEQEADLSARLATSHKADMSTQYAAATFQAAGMDEVKGLAYLDQQLKDGKIDGDVHKLALTAYKGRVTIAEGAQKQAIEGITQNASNTINAFRKEPNGAPDANALPAWIQQNPAAWDALPVAEKNALLAQQDAALKGDQPDAEFLNSVETAIRQDPEAWARNSNLAAMRHKYGNQYDDYAKKRNDILSGEYDARAEARVTNVAQDATKSAWLVVNGSDGVKADYKPEQKAALEQWVRNAIRHDQKQAGGKIGTADDYAAQAREYLQAQNSGGEMTAFTPIPETVPEGGFPFVNTLASAKSTTSEYAGAARQLHAWAPRYHTLRIKTPAQKTAYEGGLKALVRGDDTKLEALRKGIKAAHPTSNEAEIDQWVINATLKANQRADAPQGAPWFAPWATGGG